MPESQRSAPRLPADPTTVGPLPAGVGAPAPVASALLLGGFVGLTACLVLFGTLAEGIRDKEIYTLDLWANPFFHGLSSPFMDGLMNAATFAGSNLFIPPLFVITVGILVRIHRPGAALFLAVASGGSLLLNGLMKVFFQRPRPQLPWANVLPDFSFPSGHTMNSMAFDLALAVIVWSIRGRRSGIVAVVIATLLSGLIGLSRIYLGFHYFTDVLGGVLAGVGWLLVVLAAFRAGPLARFWQAPRTSPPDRSKSSDGAR